MKGFEAFDKIAEEDLKPDQLNISIRVSHNGHRAVCFQRFKPNDISDHKSLAEMLACLCTEALLESMSHLPGFMSMAAFAHNPIGDKIITKDEDDEFKQSMGVIDG